MRIVNSIIKAELLNQPALSPPAAIAVAIGADDMHADFAAGIAAETRSILDEHARTLGLGDRLRP